MKYYTSKYNNCNDDKEMNEKDLNKTIISQTGT